MPLFALVVWPFVAIILFATLPRTKAVILAIIVAYLILPEKFAINFQGLPGIDKNVVALLGVLLGLVFVNDPTRGARARHDAAPKLVNTGKSIGVIIFCLLAFMVLGGVMTIATNRDSLSFGTTFIPGQRPWDLISLMFQNLVILTPFFLGRRYLATPEAHRTLLICLVVAGLYYSLLALVEIRLSPQLHYWIYGYYQHSFLQHIRGGSFRPMLFLTHGLWVGFFFCATVIGAFSLFRSRVGQAGKWGIAAIWLLLVLFISRNLGASVIALLVVAVVWMPRVIQLRFVTSVAILFLLYPVARQYVIPLERVVSAAATVSEERAQSLQFRLENEEDLLDRAAERPLFGWGLWGRSRIYNEYGKDITITDGVWVVILGVGGWVYYVSYFGLLVIPNVALARVRRRKEIPIETMGLALISAANLIYLVPNSALSPIGWMIAGALAGFVQFDKERQEPNLANDDVNKTVGPNYSRFSASPRASLP